MILRVCRRRESRSWLVAVGWVVLAAPGTDAILAILFVNGQGGIDSTRLGPNKAGS